MTIQPARPMFEIFKAKSSYLFWSTRDSCKWYNPLYISFQSQIQTLSNSSFTIIPWKLFQSLCKIACNCKQLDHSINHIVCILIKLKIFYFPIRRYNQQNRLRRFVISSRNISIFKLSFLIRPYALGWFIFSTINLRWTIGAFTVLVRTCPDTKSKAIKVNTKWTFSVHIYVWKSNTLWHINT